MTAAAPSPQQIIEALRAVKTGPDNRDIVTAGMVGDIREIAAGEIVITLEVDPALGPALEPVRQNVERVAKNLPGLKKVTAILTAHKEGPAPLQPTRPTAMASADVRAALTPYVKNIIVVASGKGGVGKSTISTNLAISLSKNGQKTGLLDADIYGPSIPRMTGIAGQKPTQSDAGKIIPLETYGLKVMSIGLMIDEAAPIIWRGPMIQSALLQLLKDVEWGTAQDSLDVLVIDMPPGTGDAQLTLVQKAAISGAVIVSTPQDIALLDARKGLEMFRKTDIPILGIIENMSLYVCEACGHEAHIFGHGGARKEAEKLDCPFLGEIPLHIDIRENSDSGQPILAKNETGPIADAFDAIAKSVIAQLGKK